MGWKDGMHFQGSRYTYSASVINVGWLLLLWVMFIRSRKREQSFHVALLLHWVLFVWLAWYAFSFFGELPYGPVDASALSEARFHKSVRSGRGAPRAFDRAV